MTIMYLYYNQPDAIKHLESLGCPNWDVDFLFIDDGSKIPLELDWATVIRIDEDIAWNMPQANNKGLKWLNLNSDDEIVIRMDIDHYFKENDLGFLKGMEKTLKPNQIVHFNREQTHPHPNIYMAYVIDIIRAGGYDEDFSGHYGYDDKELMSRLERLKFEFIKCPLVTVKTNHSAGVKTLDRDTTHNYDLYKQKTK